MTSKSTSVPAISKAVNTNEKSDQIPFRSPAHLFMWVCCGLMVIGLAIVFLAAPSDEPITTTLWSLTPLLACLGMHLLMHRLMGRSCHNSNNSRETEK